MAQHDYIIDNQPGASFRADLNNVLAAIVSNNSGATAPTTTYPFQWWADTTADVLKQRDASNSEWQDVYPLGGGLVSQTGSTGAAILPEGSEAQRPVPGGTGLYMRLNAEAGKPEWYNRGTPAWQAFGDADAQELEGLETRVQALEDIQPAKRLRVCGSIRGSMTPATGYGLMGCTIVDRGVGDYEVVFATPAPDTTYVVGVTTQPSETQVYSFGCSIFQKTVNGFRIRPTGSAGGYLGVDWNTYKADVFIADFTVHY